MPFSIEYIEELKTLFVHLHCHSEYSNIRLLDATNKLKDMVLYVSSLGQTAIAITEHECLSSHLKLLNVVEELKKDKDIKLNPDFKVILGNEIYLVDEEQMNYERENIGYTTFFHFILLAKDNIGHEQLRKLSSSAWTRLFNYKGMERVPTFYSDFDEIVAEDKGHLVASTACLGGRLARLVHALLVEENEQEQDNIRDKIDDFINWCISMFGKEDFYIELQPSLKNEETEENDQRAYNRMAVNIAKAYGLECIITTDAHYRSEADREIHKAFLTSDEDGNGNREVDAFYGTTRFFEASELFDYMDYLEKEDVAEAILNTKKISDKIVGYNLLHEQIIPLTPLPEENTWNINEELYKQAKNYPNVKRMIESETVYDRYLMNMSLNGFKARIKEDAYEESLARMDIECEQILGVSEVRKQPISAYFTTMKKNIDLIWEEAQACVMAGRGSAGGFIINDLIGITQVNPLTQGVELPYFRFIHKSKAEMPDIDIDVPSHKKNIVFQKLKEYYNSIDGDIIRVCTFGTETSKSAIQTACRGLKINGDVGMYLSSLIPIDRGKVWSIHDCYYGNEETDRKAVAEFKNIVDEYKSRNLLEVVSGIEGLINRRSSHPCFDAETLVTTYEGLKKIVDVKKGDLVLTHNRRFKPVMELQVNDAEETYIIKAKSSFPIETTGNHPFYVRERTEGKYRSKVFSEPKWKEVSELIVGKDYLGIPVNQESIIPQRENLSLPFDKKDFWWIIGRYLGDGWTLHFERSKEGRWNWIENRVIICCSKVDESEKEEIIQKLESVNFTYRIEIDRTSYKIHITNSKDLYEYLQEFGKYAYGKYLNQDILKLPKNLLETFLEGYISADGHYDKKHDAYGIKTVSKKLAMGVMQIINKLYNRHTTLTIMPPTIEYIEGRKVNSKEKYQVRFTKDIRPKEQSFYEDGYIWTKLSNTTIKQNNKKVYNITVLEDSSYVVHGVCVHNCGSIITNQAFTIHNAIMRGASGELISQFDLSDSEAMGGIKYDLLCTKVCSMIQLTLEMLLKNNKIEWQGSLRETYDKYLHPDFIDKTSPVLWEKLNRGELLSAFQFEGGIGEQAIKLIQPTNMKEAVDGNNLMRLMSEDGKEQPLNMFVRYKNNIEEWYTDMRTYGLNEKEIGICKKLLGEDFGACNTQEKMMLISMDEEVSAFDVPTSNVLRKGVSKKKGKMFEKAHDLFYEKGRANGCRDILLDYLWNVQIAMQRG